MTQNPTDERILRDVMIRELETIQEYDRMIEQAENADVRRFLAHAITEEKEHVAEAMQLLGQLDPMQREAIEEDHSAHFRAGGPGDEALRRLTGETAEGGTTVGGSAKINAAAKVDASPKAESPILSTSDAANGSPDPVLSETPADASENPFPWAMAPNARLSDATVGAMRDDGK